MSHFQTQNIRCPQTALFSNLFDSSSTHRTLLGIRRSTVCTRFTTSPASQTSRVKTTVSPIELAFTVARVRAAHLYATVILILTLMTLSQAHAQGIGEAGAFAVDFGVQDPTAQATQDTVTGTNSVSLGWGTTSAGNSAVVLGTLSSDDGQNNVVSVGNASTGLTRRITNVAPGVLSSDAATVGQLQSAIGGIDSQANSYTDAAVNGILSQANTYTNNATAGILSSAQTYASGAASSALTSADNYANAIGANTLTAANNYTNTSIATTLSAAKTYSDNSSAATLSAAQFYANGLATSTLTSANGYANTVSANALTSANGYTDASAAATLGAAKTYTDNSSATTLSAAQLYADGVGTSTLTSANSYADTVGATALAYAKSYTDTATASTLTVAKSYADSIGATTLTSAEIFATTYANGVGSSALTVANSYTDASSAIALKSAQSYADGVGASTLVSAKSYADGVGTATLKAANNYADAVGGTALATATRYTDTKTQFFAANSMLAPAQASGLETLSLGGGSQSSGDKSVAIGSKAVAGADYSFAGGYGATVLATGGVALGQNASVSQINSVAIGVGSTATRGPQIGYTDAISGAITSSAGEVSMGSSGAERQITNVAAGSALTDAANVGQVENAELVAVNLSENYTNSTTNSLLTMLNSYGYNTSPSNGAGSVSLGNGATGTGKNSVAIGTGSVAAADNSVALGADSTATRGRRSNYKDPISGKTASSVGEVSVGGPGSERQITNVAPGSAPTDATNVAQVQAAIAQADAHTNALIGKATRQTWSVAAAAQALANLPQAPNPGQSMIGMSFGTSHGEIGMAAGGSYFMPNDSVIVKASASYSGEGGMSGGMGVGFILN
jgi:autotransporter adhesin